jgi:hypothetical protein
MPVHYGIIRVVRHHDDLTGSGCQPESAAARAQLFETFLIGRDINAKDDIVYLNFSSLWHLLILLNVLCKTATLPAYARLVAAGEWGCLIQEIS